MNILEFAINMELDGEQYYNEQAEINKGNGLNKVFLMLAADEKSHAQVLKSKTYELSDNLKDSKTIVNCKNIFDNIGDFKSEITSLPSQLDSYRGALEKEQESIELYKKLLSESTNEKEKQLFKEFIKEEKAHFTILEDLVLLLNRPQDWVESAEFNITEKY